MRDRDYVFWTEVFTGKPLKVEGKAHYERLMVEGGFVPYEKAQELAYEAKRSSSGKEYKPSPDLIDFLRSLKQTADKDGNIVLGNRALAKMRELGVNLDQYLPEYLRKEKPITGGSFI